MATKKKKKKRAKKRAPKSRALVRVPTDIPVVSMAPYGDETPGWSWAGHHARLPEVPVGQKSLWSDAEDPSHALVPHDASDEEEEAPRRKKPTALARRRDTALSVQLEGGPVGNAEILITMMAAQALKKNPGMDHVWIELQTSTDLQAAHALSRLGRGTLEPRAGGWAFRVSRRASDE